MKDLIQTILAFFTLLQDKITTEFKPKLMHALTSGLGVVVLTALGFEAEMVVQNIEKVFAAFASLALMLGITGMGKTKGEDNDEK